MVTTPNPSGRLRPALILPLLFWNGAYGLLLIAHAHWPGHELALLMGYLVAFGMLALCIVASAWCASIYPWPRIWVWTGACLCLLGVACLDPSDAPLSALLGGALLMVAASQVGVLFGRGIQSASHIWPLVIVAVCVDAWSVFSTQGVSHALVVEGAAPSSHPFLLFSVPVPGIGVTPVLGVADLLFTSLLLGAFARLGFPLRRPLIGVGLGFMLCVGTVLVSAMPIPALIFIAPLPALAMGAELRPKWSEVGLACAFVMVLIGVITCLQTS